MTEPKGLPCQLCGGEKIIEEFKGEEIEHCPQCFRLNREEDNA